MLQVQRLLQITDFERLPTCFREEFADRLLRGSVPSAVHHPWPQIVARVRVVFEILQSVSAEILHDVHFQSQLLHHFGVRFRTVQPRTRRTLRWHLRHDTPALPAVISSP